MFGYMPNFGLNLLLCLNILVSKIIDVLVVVFFIAFSMPFFYLYQVHDLLVSQWLPYGLGSGLPCWSGELLGPAGHNKGISILMNSSSPLRWWQVSKFIMFLLFSFLAFPFFKCSVTNKQSVRWWLNSFEASNKRKKLILELTWELTSL